MNKVGRVDLDLSAILGGAEANPLRGKAHVPMARAFADRYPPGSHLTNSQLDDFLKEWVAAYAPEKRASCAKRLRSAGSHPRLRETGHPGFWISSDYCGGWRVVACNTALQRGFVLDEIRKFSETKSRDLLHLAEGVDLTQFPGTLADYLRLALGQQIDTMKSYLHLAEQAARRVDRIFEVMVESAALRELPAGEDLDL